MALAALDLFARIKTTWSAGFRGLDRLTVDDNRRRRGFTPLRLASLDDKNGDKLRPQTAVAPCVETILHGCERREFLRQITSRATATDQIKQSV
jgi:hypothetical protein